MITKGCKPQTRELTHQKDKIEQVTSFKYLGIELCQDGNTSIARKMKSIKEDLRPIFNW